MDDMDLIARLKAYEAGRAQPYATHVQVAIRPDALVLCPIAMSGEDTSVHIIACGQVGTPAEIWCVPDPRLRDDQDRLFALLLAKIDAYYLACHNEGTYPQIWVSSTAAASHLDILSDRLRYNSRDFRLRRLGELLTYTTQRYPIAGQQALHVATKALKRHWVTGQQDLEDEHLATVLTWITPPPGKNILAVIAERERLPMGIHTDPRFDADILAPLVDAYNSARKKGASASELGRRSKQIQAALEPVVTLIYKATQRAIWLLCRPTLPRLPGLSAMEEREAQEFASFMASRDEGYGIPLRDRPKAAAFNIVAREDAVPNEKATILIGDRVARAKGRLNGEVVYGIVSSPRRIRLGKRQFEWRFELVSNQRTPRVRLRDELCLVADSRLKVLVTGIQRTGPATKIVLQVLKGQQAVGLPEEGSYVEFTETVPDWERLGRIRKRLKTCLESTPWTHAANEPVPHFPSRPAPADPLAAVEALR